MMENWFVMINAPSDQGQDWEELKRIARRNVLNKLSRVLGVSIEELIVTLTVAGNAHCPGKGVNVIGTTCPPIPAGFKTAPTSQVPFAPSFEVVGNTNGGSFSHNGPIGGKVA